MPANVYECLFLLDTNRVAGDIPAAAKQIHTVLERNQAEVLASRPWDERRLAYPVKGHKKGLYYLTYFRTDAKNLFNIERDFALTEMVLRQMVLHVDPKHVDTMLAIARDEHALALQVAPEPGTEGGEEGGPGAPEGRRHHRRSEEAGKEM